MKRVSRAMFLTGLMYFSTPSYAESIEHEGVYSCKEVYDNAVETSTLDNLSHDAVFIERCSRYVHERKIKERRLMMKSRLTGEDYTGKDDGDGNN